MDFLTVFTLIDHPIITGFAVIVIALLIRLLVYWSTGK